MGGKEGSIKLEEAVKPKDLEKLKIEEKSEQSTSGGKKEDAGSVGEEEKRVHKMESLYTDAEKDYAVFFMKVRRATTLFARKIKEAIPKKYAKDYFGLIEVSFTKGDIHVSKLSFHFKPLGGAGENKDHRESDRQNPG